MNIRITWRFHFRHKATPKLWWQSRDGITKNQIDHIHIEKKFRSLLRDIHLYKGADIDSDHYLTSAKVQLKLRKTKEAIRTWRLDYVNLKIPVWQQISKSSWQTNLRQCKTTAMILKWNGHTWKNTAMMLLFILLDMLRRIDIRRDLGWKRQEKSLQRD